ncbi:unnamed protein product [Ectocarpus sp. 4 AP-2014]
MPVRWRMHQTSRPTRLLIRFVENLSSPGNGSSVLHVVPWLGASRGDICPYDIREMLYLRSRCTKFSGTFRSTSAFDQIVSTPSPYGSIRPGERSPFSRAFSLRTPPYVAYEQVGYS